MGLLADKDYYANADGEIVSADAEDANELVAREGSIVSEETAEKFNLSLGEAPQEVRYRGQDVSGMAATDSNADLRQKGIAPDTTNVKASATTTTTVGSSPAAAGVKTSAKKGAVKK